MRAYPANCLVALLNEISEVLHQDSRFRNKTMFSAFPIVDNNSANLFILRQIIKLTTNNIVFVTLFHLVDFIYIYIYFFFYCYHYFCYYSSKPEAYVFTYFTHLEQFRFLRRNHSVVRIGNVANEIERGYGNICDSSC